MALVTLVVQGRLQIFAMAKPNTMIQSFVSDHRRGRPVSIYALDRGLLPAVLMLAGNRAHYLGAAATVTLMGAIVIVLAEFIVNPAS